MKHQIPIAYLILVLTKNLESSSALQIGLDNGKQRSIYYTSAHRKCTSPRLVNPVKTDYSLITQVHDDDSYPTSPLLVPVEFQNPTTCSTGRESCQPKPYSTQSLDNLGCAFSLNSGFLNGLCLSGVIGRAMPVAAVTGTYTKAAVAYLGRQQLGALAAILASPLCYMLGSMVNGLCNPEGTMRMDHLSILQSLPLLVAGAMILLANLVMKHHVFVTCLCITFALGLQNSWTSTILPGNLLRTTHFSGITSDFGTILGQTLRGNHANAYKLTTFAHLTMSFWLGGIVSQLAVRTLGLAPSLCYTMSALFYFGVWAMLQHSLRRALMTYQQSILASLRQRYRTTVAFFNFWWKERLGRKQRRLSWNT